MAVFLIDALYHETTDSKTMSLYMFPAYTLRTVQIDTVQYTEVSIVDVLQKLDHTIWWFFVSCFLELEYINGFLQDCSNSIANALELLQYCTKPSACNVDMSSFIILIWLA